jgi:nicotinate-nucleotide adenylyltransferase
MHMSEPLVGAFGTDFDAALRAALQRIGSVAQQVDQQLFDQHLVGQHPDCQFRLLIGADILAEQSSWYRFDELARLAPPMVIGRSGYPSPAGVPELPAISSTRIRELLRCGQPAAAWLPAGVLDYISAEGLYGPGDLEQSHAP